MKFDFSLIDSIRGLIYDVSSSLNKNILYAGESVGSINNVADMRMYVIECQTESLYKSEKSMFKNEIINQV